MTNVQKTTVLLTRSHLRVPHGPIAWECCHSLKQIMRSAISVCPSIVNPTRSSAIAKTAERTNTILVSASGRSVTWPTCTGLCHLDSTFNYLTELSTTSVHVSLHQHCQHKHNTTAWQQRFSAVDVFVGDLMQIYNVLWTREVYQRLAHQTLAVNSCIAYQTPWLMTEFPDIVLTQNYHIVFFMHTSSTCNNKSNKTENVIY